MSGFLDRLGRDVLVADGAMGSLLIASGADPAGSLDHLNLTAPEMVESVHRQYVQAGADIVTTNTFQASRPRLAEHGLADQLVAINRAGVELARRAKPSHVAASVGPTGLLIEPLGPATFQQAFEAFAEQIEALAAAGPDFIQIETIGDISEARAALLAAKSVTDLPVAVSCTFGSDGRTNLSGTPPAAVAVILSRMGADLVGANCGLGPVETAPIAAELVAFSSVPVIIQPNAGMPRLEQGKTAYPGSPDESAREAERMRDGGVAVVGSCCGSTPAFTAAISAAVGGLDAVPTQRVTGLLLASRTQIVAVGPGEATAIVGERLNPSGRKALAEALRSGEFGAYRELAIAQARAGATLLDVNVGLAGVDQVSALSAAVAAVSDAAQTPLVIDSTDPAAVEAALRRYPGRALVNSVSGTEESLDGMLPVVARYGAAALVMPLDDDGIPATADGRLALARRIAERAAAAGLGLDDLILDGVVMAAATGPEAAEVTLETVRRARAELGLATILGVSNISHGMPERGALNRTFLAMAQQAGVDAVMADAMDADVRAAAAAGDLLAGRDPRGARYLSSVADVAAPRPDTGRATPAERLAAVVEDGDADSAEAAAAEALASGMDPVQAIAEVLTPAIQRLGAAFGRGEAFLPQLIQSAEAMKRAVDRLKRDIPAGASEPRGKILLATVAGDIHSIGKDIVASMLESRGFEIEDLGVNVAADAVIEAVKSDRPDAVGLSALMTTTLPAMAETVRRLHEATDLPIVVGGAVLTADWAAEIGAGYAKDAVDAVRVMEEVVDAERARRGPAA
jgi:5-methyltetrahydrofolate--homocysteine methyltransferase